MRELTDRLKDLIGVAVDYGLHYCATAFGEIPFDGRKRLHYVLPGITLGLLYNPITGPETRRWLKDLVGGGSDEFGGDYNPSGSGNSGSA